MIDDWILSQLAPLSGRPTIVLRDPQRLIQPGAQAVDGWAEANGYTVLFCTGNLALREMYEAIRDDGARVLLVDRSRKDARIPLFYPDLDVQAAASGARLELSLRQYLVEATGDPRWPPLVEDRNLSRLLCEHLPAAIRAHRDLRAVARERFTDSDLHRIILGAALGINPFRSLTPAEIRRLCIEQHGRIEELRGALPAETLDELRRAITSGPKPFCYLLDHDPQLVIRSFTLAAIMRQHGLDHRLLLPNVDPAMHTYREIEASFLDGAMADQLRADPDRVADDVKDAEAFLQKEPGRLRFLLHEQLHVDDPEEALGVLRRERLSPMVRSLALLSLFLDLLSTKSLKLHRQALSLLEAQANDPTFFALRRPSEPWQALERVYRRTVETRQLVAKLRKVAKELKVQPADKLRFETFDAHWNGDGVNRIDYYLSDLSRTLRLGYLLPLHASSLWPELSDRWQAARGATDRLAGWAQQQLDYINTRFQDLYAGSYSTWVRRPQAPAVFTHQFLSRMLKPHWDPQSGRKAIILVFDGLRTDAWEELLRPVFEERLEVLESLPGSAIVPTETQLSRKAIAAGCLPWEFISQNELHLLRHWLKERLRLDPAFRVCMDDDTASSGISVWYSSPELDYIVFAFSDRNLHNNGQDLAFIYDTMLGGIIRQDVRAVLRDLPEDGVVFVTGDHGFTPMPEAVVTVEEGAAAPEDIRYRYAELVRPPAPDASRYLSFPASDLGLPPESRTNRARTRAAYEHVLFPRPGYTLGRPGSNREPDRYGHGGISMAECFVPMVMLGPKQQHQPLLSLERLQQVGSVAEGEPLTLEVTVSALRLGLSDMTIGLAFSQEEVGSRREVFSEQQQVYTVRWQPRLQDVTEEERRQGIAVRPLTVTLSYQEGKTQQRQSRSTDIRIKLDPGRLRRRLDSKLDLLMGKTPKGLE